MMAFKHRGRYLVCLAICGGAFIAAAAGVGNGLYRLDRTLRDTPVAEAGGVLSEVRNMVGGISTYFVCSLVFLVLVIALSCIVVRCSNARNA